MIGEETIYGIYLILWYISDDGYKHPTKFKSVDEQISKIEIL